MFFKPHQQIFLLTLTGGTFMAISANSWFMSWLGLEINLLSMLPLMLSKINKSLTEAATKYFLIQAAASTLLIAGVNLNMTSAMTNLLFSSEGVLILALMMKAGVPPFHFWFPEVSSNLNWHQCFILFTWQKVAPLLLIMNMKYTIILIISMTAILTGALGGLSQLYLKPLLAYSSIAHSGWVLAAAAINFLTWTLYFIIYCLLSLSVIWSLNKSPAKKISEVTLQSETLLSKSMFIFNMLSLGGLPPFLGFTAKISLIILLIYLNMKLTILFFVALSLISLYFYARLIYFFMFNKQKMKIFYLMAPRKTNNIPLILCSLTNISVPIFNVFI